MFSESLQITCREKLQLCIEYKTHQEFTVRKCLLTLALLALAAIGAAVVPAGWQTHNDAEYGYTISHPADWTAEDMGEGIHLISAPQTGGLPFADLVSIIVQAGTPDLTANPDSTFSSYLDLLKDQSPLLGLGSIEVTKEGPIEFKGQRAYGLDLNLDLLGLLAFRMENIVMDHLGNTVFLSFISSAETAAGSPVFDAIRQSFGLTPKGPKQD